MAAAPRTRGRRRTPAAGAAMLVVLSLAACTSARRGQFARFAEAGVAYAAAVDVLTRQAAGAAIDADSAALEKSRPALDEAERARTVLEHDRLLEERVGLLADIRRHADLLRSYFVTLAALADPNPPAAAADAARRLAATMGRLSDTIRRAEISGVPVDEYTGTIVAFTVARYQRALLERELEARAGTLERELDTQEAAMRAIADELRADLRAVIDQQERRDVIDPYRADRALPANWTRRRREVLTATPAVDAADAAAGAAATMKVMFAALVENRFEAADFEALLADVNEIITLLEPVAGSR